MTFFYAVAVIPLLVSLALLRKNEFVVWWEYLISTAIAFLIAGIFHWGALRSSTGDYETWSGEITNATFHPYWKERYTEEESYTEGSGKKAVTKTRTVTKYRDHSEYWDANTTLFRDREITEDLFNTIRHKFKSYERESGHRSGLVRGDPNVYVAYNKTGYCFPVTQWVHFENRIKAVPTLFQFAKVPKDIPVLSYPQNKDWLASDRVAGTARKTVTPYALDCLNARLGASKKVNLILVGFEGQDSEIGQWQQSAWVGGKKNDLVLCYDTSETPAKWAFCFGWSEQDVVKRSLETIASTDGVSDATLPEIEQEIIQDYQIEKWKKFNYINIPPPTWAMVWFPIATLITQAAFWYFAITQNMAGVRSRSSRSW